MWTKILSIVFAVLFPIVASATVFLSEDWDTGTPTGCWPCETAYCTTPFRGWYTDYGTSVVASGLATDKSHSGTRSFYNYKQANTNGGCSLQYDITGSPTTIYVRFYLYLGTSWSTYPSYANSDNDIIHFLFTNTQQSSTGFRLNLVNNNYTGMCPVGDICLLPEGQDGTAGSGTLWWENAAWVATATSATDMVQYIGAWHCFEYKMQIVGQQVALTEWVDGVLKRGPIQGQGSNTSYFDKIIFHLWDNDGGPAVRDYWLDDIVVSDTYIGPIGGEDTTAPVVTITAPTSSATYYTSSSTINISGTATDAVGVTSVTWVNDRGGSGTSTCTGCPGTSVTWSQSNIALSYGGVNVITFTARDAANNTHTDTLTVSYPPPDLDAPVISNPLPSGAQTCAANPLPTTLQITTNENATCKYGTSNVVYDSLPNTFATTGTTSHSQMINLNCGNSYTYYTRCKDVYDNKSASATTISFSIGASDMTPPTIVSYSPMSQQACTQDPKPIVMQVQTSESATCKYGTADSAYASFSNTFSSTGGTSHSQSINKACGGVATNYYVRCQDGVGNAMLTSQNIQLSAPVPAMRGQGVVAGGIR